MHRFVFAPDWVYGYDVAFYAISAIIVILIALYGLKLYNYSGNKRHKYFGLSFLMIAISFAFQALSNLVAAPEAIVGQLVWGISVTELTAQPPLFMVAYLGYRLFMLLGILGIYSIVSKTKRENLWLSIYLILIVTFFSTATYLIFYTTTFIILFSIVLYYHRNYKNLKTRQSLMVLLAFSSIMFGQLLFLGLSYKMYIYVIAEVFQLIGYLLLLFSYLGLVVKNGKANKD